jgi:hypothetical protein
MTRPSWKWRRGAAYAARRRRLKPAGRAAGGRRPPLVAATASTVASGRGGHELCALPGNVPSIAHSTCDVKEYKPAATYTGKMSVRSLMPSPHSVAIRRNKVRSGQPVPSWAHESPSARSGPAPHVWGFCDDVTGSLRLSVTPLEVGAGSRNYAAISAGHRFFARGANAPGVHILIAFGHPILKRNPGFVKKPSNCNGLHAGYRATRNGTFCNFARSSKNRAGA